MTQALYRLRTQPISRAHGKSAVAASAYRAGEALLDARRERIEDYSRRGGVVGSTVLTPESAPDWMHERELLWNAVAAKSTRKDFREARELQLSLPRALAWEESMVLVERFIQEQFVWKEGLVADIAYHDAPARDGGRNPHAHVLITPYPVAGDGSGFAHKKNRWIDSPLALKAWHEEWSAAVNTALEAAGSEARVDHRPLHARGSDRTPEHMGRSVVALEDKGQRTAQGDQCREARITNRLREQRRPALIRDVVNEQEQLSAAQQRTHDLLQLSRRIYTG